MSDDLFQFGMPQDPKASHSKKSGAKKSSNDALFAGISSQATPSQSTTLDIFGGFSQQSQPEEDDIFKNMELDVNFTSTPLPEIRPARSNQLISMTREEIKVEISANHYGEPKQAASSEPTKLVIQSLSSKQVGYDVQKSWFQRYIFDFTKWSPLFVTSTKDVRVKLTDAFWPFQPCNQPNYMNLENKIGQRRAMTAQVDELYGPIWIMLTLIIELLILGHVSALFKIEMGAGVDEQDKELLDEFINRFGNSSIFDPTNTTANDALRKIVTLTFIVVSFFLIVPFSIYMVFRSAAPPSHETSFMRFFMLYAYSMAVFIPAAGLYTIFMDFARVQWLTMILAIGFASYFLFKETIEVSKRSLTYAAFTRTAGAVVVSTALFSLLLRFYFLAI